MGACEERAMIIAPFTSRFDAIERECTDSQRLSERQHSLERHALSNRGDRKVS